MKSLTCVEISTFISENINRVVLRPTRFRISDGFHGLRVRHDFQRFDPRLHVSRRDEITNNFVLVRDNHRISHCLFEEGW